MEKIGEGYFTEVFYDGTKCIINTMCEAKIALADIKGEHIPNYTIKETHEKYSVLWCDKYDIDERNFPHPDIDRIYKLVGRKYHLLTNIENIIDTLIDKIQYTLIVAIKRILENLKYKGFEKIFFDVRECNIGTDRHGEIILFDLISIYL